ncbi:MAG: hypothetical protein R3C68_01720 [Myxococcota bacterium]
MVEVSGGIYEEGINNNLPGGTSWESPFTLRAKKGESATLQPPVGFDRVVFLTRPTHHAIIDGFVIDGATLTSRIKITYSGTDPSISSHHTC